MLIRRLLPALFIALLWAAPSASAAIVINEVESDGADFVELFNTGAAGVQLDGYQVKDNGNNNTVTLPAGASIGPSGFYVVNASGLGDNDSARLYAASDLNNPIDTYTWGTHAATTYGRCPDGTGAFTTTRIPTRGEANDCGPAVVGVPWPGGAAVAVADDLNVFGQNLSGLAYQPSGSALPGVLWASQNNPSKLWRLVYDGTKWTPDTTNGWATGKILRYPGAPGAGAPDAEGVTLVGGDPANGVYVSSERDGSGATRPSVLRYDVSSAATTLDATREWNLTADLPPMGDNLGLEAIGFIPDDFLVAKGFKDQATGVAYNPATYPNHGSGLFFVGSEQSGTIYGYALTQNADTFTRVATLSSGFPTVMDLEFEPESGHFWAACDDTCEGRTATLDIAQSGADAGKLVVTNTFQRPAGMANLNNEGFAIAPQKECVGGFKPVFWSDDSSLGGHALHSGTLNCTPTVAATPTPTPTVTVTVAPTTTPVATVTPTVTATPDTTAPVVSKVRASRKRVAFTLSEAADVKITVQRRKGKSFKRVKAFTVAAAAGAKTVKFKGRIKASKIKKGVLRITLVATDAAGNVSAATRKRVPS